MNHSATSTAQASRPTITSQPDDDPRFYSYVPILTRGNYPEWQLCVKTYLTPNDHVRVIQRTKDSSGNLLDPVAPTDAAELEKWTWSEQEALGIIMGTAADLHLELVLKHDREDSGVWPLWKAIEAQHVADDATLRLEAWLQLFSARKRPGESYVDLYRRVDNARSVINRTTPAGQTPDEFSYEITLFSFLSALHAEDPLRLQLIAKKNVTLDDVYLACAAFTF